MKKILSCQLSEIKVHKKSFQRSFFFRTAFVRKATTTAVAQWKLRNFMLKDIWYAAI